MRARMLGKSCLFIIPNNSVGSIRRAFSSALQKSEGIREACDKTIQRVKEKKEGPVGKARQFHTAIAQLVRACV